MAGDWIKMECATPDKPEVLSITVAMGWEDPDLTVGKLFKLWRWFDQHTVEGNAPNVTPALLDRIVGVTGFSEAVASVGWLTLEDKGVTLPNFGRHNGKTAKNRAQTAKRVSKNKSNGKTNGEGNGGGVTESLPREEKRREEGEEEGPPPAPPKKSPCPYQEIVETYHEVLPELPNVEILNDTRKKHLRSRWVTSEKTQSLDWWREYFAFVRQQPFLMGSNDRNWKADFDFLITESKFVKVVEGAYAKGGAQ